MKRTRGLFPRCLGVISRIRWLTHTGRDMPPSGLKPNSLTRGFIKHRDFGEINNSVPKGSMLAEGSEPEPIDHRQRFVPLALSFASFASLR